MLAGFVDLAALGLPKPGLFAPFIGAGVGAEHTRIGKKTIDLPGDYHDRAGREQDGAGLDGDGGSRGGAERARQL